MWRLWCLLWVMMRRGKRQAGRSNKATRMASSTPSGWRGRGAMGGRRPVRPTPLHLHTPQGVVVGGGGWGRARRVGGKGAEA